MARFAGVDLPHEKHMEIALTYTCGVGRTRAKKILESTGVSPDTRVKDLMENELIKSRDFTQANYKVEGDLRCGVVVNIRRKIGISCYQDRRRHTGLPVHGQRAKANVRIRKGSKRTVAGKKKVKWRGHQQLWQ